MPKYPDNRKAFKDIAPWDVPSGTPRFDNPKKYDSVVRVRPAIRGTPPAFRSITAPKPPEPEPEPPKPYVEPIPEHEEL